MSKKILVSSGINNSNKILIRESIRYLIYSVKETEFDIVFINNNESITQFVTNLSEKIGVMNRVEIVNDIESQLNDDVVIGIFIGGEQLVKHQYEFLINNLPSIPAIPIPTTGGTSFNVFDFDKISDLNESIAKDLKNTIAYSYLFESIFSWIKK